MMHYAIGDQAAPARRAPICHPGPARWHALMVYPQRESAAKAWLDRRGVYAFFPVKSETRFVRGAKIERERRYLPGYLFARFPGEAIQAALWDSPFIHDGIRYRSGSLGALTEESIASLKAMRSRDDDITEQWRIARTPRKGDRVRISYRRVEIETEVVEIVAGKVRVKVEMLGERFIDVGMDRVEKIG